MLVINDIVMTSRKINTFTGKKNTEYKEDREPKSGTKSLPIMAGLVALGAAGYAVHNIKKGNNPVNHTTARPQIINNKLRKNNKTGNLRIYELTGPFTFDMAKIGNKSNISDAWKKYRNDITERTKKFSDLFGIKPEPVK